MGPCSLSQDWGEVGMGIAMRGCWIGWVLGAIHTSVIQPSGTLEVYCITSNLHGRKWRPRKSGACGRAGLDFESCPPPFPAGGAQRPDYLEYA